MTDPTPTPENATANAVATYGVLGLLVLGTGVQVLLSSQATPADAALVTNFFTVDTLLSVVVQALVVVMLVAVTQLVTDGDWAPLGSWEAVRERASFFMALGLGCGMFVLMSFVIPQLAVQVWPELIDSHPDVFAGSIPDLPTLLLATFIVVIGGAIREELWRVAWLRAWERLGDQWVVAGIWISAIAFGSVHAYEGVPAMAITAIMGLLLAYRWRARRDLSELIIIHGVHNTLTLVLLYVTPLVAAP